MMIGFAGEGWGAVTALPSLQAFFPAIEVLSPDPEVLNLLRPSDRVLTTLESASTSHIVCAAYKPLVPATELAKRCFVNIHYSLLPKYRGMHPVIWGILNGEQRFGFSIHLMNEDIDDGAILAQYEIPYAGQTSAELMQHFNQQVGRMLGQVMHDYVGGRLTPKAQNKNEASWVPKRNRDDCLIDFNSSCVQLERFFKALVRPYPLPSLRSDDKIYEVSQAKIIYRPYGCTTGRVVNIDADGVWIKIADGLLVVQTLEDPQGYAQPAAALLKRGQRLT